MEVEFLTADENLTAGIEGMNGQKYRGPQALCAGIQGAQRPCRGSKGQGHFVGLRAKHLGRVQGGSACAECRGGKPLLRCPEVENLGPGKVDVCVNLYWVLPDAGLRRSGSFAAPLPQENLEEKE